MPSSSQGDINQLEESTLRAGRSTHSSAETSSWQLVLLQLDILSILYFYLIAVRELKFVSLFRRQTLCKLCNFQGDKQGCLNNVPWKVFCPFLIFFLAYLPLKIFRKYCTKITRVNTKCSFEIMIYFIKGKKLSKPAWPYVKNCPLNLIIGCATLYSNNCNQVIVSISHHWGGILAHSSLQNCFNSATLEVFQGRMDCLRSCHSISIEFKSRLWLGCSKTLILFFLSHLELDLLVCLGSLSCCITQVSLSLRTFSFRIFW